MKAPDHDAAQPVEPDDEADDQAWFHLMAGRAVPTARPSVRQEAAWLRAAMLSYRSVAPPGGPADAEQRMQRLLVRARREGVLPDAEDLARDAQPTAGSVRPDRPAANWGSWASWSTGLALAAALAVFMVAPALLTPNAVDEPSQMRGEVLQTLEASAPLQRQQQVLQTLLAAGFKAQTYVRLGRPGIDVDLPSELSASQLAALASLGVRRPVGGSLQIEFKPLSGSPPASAP